MQNALLFGLPMEKVNKATLGSKVYYSAKLDVQMYGAAYPIVFDYTNSTYISLEFYDDDKGFRYSRMYITAYAKYPVIPKKPVPWVSKPNDENGTGGDALGVHTKVVIGEPTGSVVNHPSVANVLVTVDDPNPTSLSETGGDNLTQAIYLAIHPWLTVAEYNLISPPAREGMVALFGDISGGNKVPARMYRSSTAQYQTVVYSGIFYMGAAGMNTILESSLTNYLVPKRYPNDSDIPQEIPPFYFVGSPVDAANYKSIWIAGRAAATEREREIALLNSDRVVAAMQAGMLPMEVVNSIYDTKPFFFEGEPSRKLTITVSELSVENDPAVTGNPNPALNHPARPYFYTRPTIVKYITPGTSGYNWSTGAREKLSSELVVMAKIKRTVTIAFSYVDGVNEDTGEDIVVDRSYSYEGYLSIEQYFTYSDQRNAMRTSYLFDNWPAIDEDGMFPYFGDMAYIVDLMYELNSVTVVPTNLLYILDMASKAKATLTEEKAIADNALEVANARVPQNPSEIATAQAAATLAQTALDKAIDVHSTVVSKLPDALDVVARDKLLVSYKFERSLNKVEDASYEGCILNGRAGMDYSLMSARFVDTTTPHTTVQLTLALGKYLDVASRDLELKARLAVEAAKGTDNDRIAAANEARDTAAAHKTDVEVLIAKAIESQNAKGVVKATYLRASKFPAIREFLDRVPLVERSQYDI